MKKHVCLFDESSRASTYGVGTYIRQITVCLTDISELTVHVVHIGADVEHFEIKEMQGMIYIIFRNTVFLWKERQIFTNGIFTILYVQIATVLTVTSLFLCLIIPIIFL